MRYTRVLLYTSQTALCIGGARVGQIRWGVYWRAFVGTDGPGEKKYGGSGDGIELSKPTPSAHRGARRTPPTWRRATQRPQIRS